MPHLLIRGISPEQIREISKPLVSELALLCQCPEDDMMLECLSSTACFAGEFVQSYPFIEVNWFDRGQSVQDQAAMCIDRHVRAHGIAEVEIAFRSYEKNNYYANGVKLSVVDENASVAELQALKSENERLKDELHKARKALQANPTSSASHMSSRLYDALRE